MKHLAKLAQLEPSDAMGLRADFDDMVILADRIQHLAEGESALSDSVSLAELREDVPGDAPDPICVTRTVISRMRGV